MVPLGDIYLVSAKLEGIKGTVFLLRKWWWIFAGCGSDSGGSFLFGQGKHVIQNMACGVAGYGDFVQRIVLVQRE